MNEHLTSSHRLSLTWPARAGLIMLLCVSLVAPPAAAAQRRPKAERSRKTHERWRHERSPGRTEVSLVGGQQARRLLGENRDQLLRVLESRSKAPVSFSVDAATGVILSLSLDYPLEVTREGGLEQSARAFLADFQPLIDPRVMAAEFVALRQNQGCSETSVVFDRAVGGRLVLGGKLTLHFSRAGHLVGLVNGVASVPARVLPATALAETRREIQRRWPRPSDQSMCRRYDALVPEGVGDAGLLRQANLVLWDERPESSGRVYRATFEGLAGRAPEPFVIRDPVGLPTGGEIRRPLPLYHLDPRTELPDSISYHPVGGVEIERLPGERNPAEIVYRFLERHRGLFRTGAARCQYGVKGVSESPLLPGVQFVRMQQRYLGLPVFGAGLAFEVHDGNRVMSVEGHVLPRIEINPTPRLTPDEAAASARTNLLRALVGEGRADFVAGEILEVNGAVPVTELVIFPGRLVPDRELPDRLAYKVALADHVYFVDAQTGEALYSYSTREESIPLVKEAGGRNELFDSRLMYLLVQVDLTPTGALPLLNSDVGPSAVSAKAIDSFFRRLGRDSWDGEGSQYVINTNVRLTRGCPNAIFSQSYGEVFLCFGVGRQPDALAHEFTHGVLTRTPLPMVTQDQPGALREAYSDLFGNLIFPDNPSPGNLSAWMIGEPATSGGPRVGTGPIRDMQTPSNFTNTVGLPQADTMDQFLSRNDLRVSGCAVVDPPPRCDRGFVHSNSGIISNAHVRLAEGIPAVTPTPTPSPGATPLPIPTPLPRLTPGIGRAKLALLAYEVMTQKLGTWSRFMDASLAMRNMAETLAVRRAAATDGSTFVQADIDEVRWAFDAVGLTPAYQSGWGERTFADSGTRPRFEGQTTCDTLENGQRGNCCPVTNVLLTLPSPAGDLVADLSLATRSPTTVDFEGIYGASLVTPQDGTRPPIGTTSMEHTVSWFNVYGFMPEFKTEVIAPGSDCRAPQGFISAERVVPLDGIVHSFLRGDPTDGTDTVGNAASNMDPRCEVTGVVIEMLDSGGNWKSGAEVSETAWTYFFNQEVKESRGARFTNPGALPNGAGTPGQTRNLSAEVRWFFGAYYGSIKYRLRYYINEPTNPGGPRINCDP